MKGRIVGIDVARALAVFGMIIVNFKIVFGDGGNEWLKAFVSIFDGKAAATFVVLAGVGLALMTKSALAKNDTAKLALIRKRISKRALFLFIVGTSYLPIWPADILHFYGVYLLVFLLFMKSSDRLLLLGGLGLILLFPLLLLFLDYEVAWNFITMEYQDFWTVKGFFRNLFFNGFHPVIPWAAFILFGFWLGKQNLYDDGVVRKILLRSLFVFLIVQSLSYAGISLLSEGNPATAEKLSQLIGTSPMPPLPLYMFSGLAIAFVVITACILIARYFSSNQLIIALQKTGQLALTFYVAHVIIGMGLVEVFSTTRLGDFSIGFSFSYAIMFSLLCLVFAVLYTRNFKTGPLEWIMRKLTH